ncbi:pyridoxal phosphate-dependent aminotransferase [Rhodococcus pyridinivorans]|uniref:pyridoxal phosphate-dependent aminotransferase n=2 Tax=Rhodococcus TaxID=1827 RepID=UPI0007CD89B9|nr:pyridoxal phosphate-dependent aminotransferase [Rhodococcus pyridinivorans]QXF80586.1 pyridoxal phosphate-dependent aminotransferase [Rhodococcus pyridinivorans]UPK63913.1 pyridoxal phosphate-dependent aminotransferase [Rhodococcus pyridinivorans]UPW04290.1 pyridoxal phosphate-dependent aminotransferase [Rhodococcus pyridinivorans]USI91990.1 pyridoxal phosphate-dependent aminotransferase [Rhodococcus pyridinivorans]SED18995.1 Aspartate/methionine/tyrosine aminotransferase [Rhodococcus pyrid
MTLTMQQWIFVESYGRYTLDLGDSNVELADITTVPGFAEITTVPLGYGHQAGLPELRAAIAARYHNVDPADVLVCHGAQEAFSLLVRSLEITDRSEAVVIGSGWSQHTYYPAEVGLSVVTVALDPCEHTLLAAVAEAVTWRTKVIVVATPENPTGWTASRDFIEAVADIADAYDAVLVVDEEYVCDPDMSAAGISDCVAVISGLSKLHGLPGLRIGWCIATADLVDRCTQRKHLTTISNSVLCESIATAVLRDGDRFLARARTLCRSGAHTLQEWASVLPQVSIVNARDDLPFAWLRIDKSLDSLAVARRALDEGVLVIPGEVFDRPGYLRVAIARPPVDLDRGLKVLARAVCGPRLDPLTAGGRA